jgi:general secretion pathway protein L
MSVLVVQIPPRPRLSARAEGGEGAPAAARGELAYVVSNDGLHIVSQGRAPVALLPRADTVVAVLAPHDVSWQRIAVPKAPPAKVRAALVGLLEDTLLEEADELHLALSPNATPGLTAWVAVMNKAWLQAELAALEKGGRVVERVVPTLWPGDAPQGHFHDDAGAAEGTPRPAVTLADPTNIVTLPLAGTLARALVPPMLSQPTRWTATPSVAAPAERWLGMPVMVQSDNERLLQAARSLWNLRQFDLVAKRAGARAVRDAARRLWSPGWRPVRVGVATLAVLHVVGLNAWAFAQERAKAGKRAAQVALLKAAHPGVRAVLDAPLQMQRETDALRAAAGRVGDNDFESMLAAAASAWPEGQGPAPTVRYEPGKLTLVASGWSEDQVNAFRDHLRLTGWQVEHSQGRVALSRVRGVGAEGGS